MRKIFNILLGVWVAAIGLVLILSLYLYFFFPYNQIRSLAQREARKTLGVRLELGEMRFSLFEGLSIDTISITDPPFTEPVLQLNTLVVDYNLWALMSKKLQINQVLLDSPVINLLYRDGAWNLERIANRLEDATQDEPPETEVAGLPLKIHLKKFVIRNPKVFAEKPGEFKITFSGIDIQAQGRMEEEYSRLNVSFSTSEDGSSLEATLPEISIKSHPQADLHLQIDDFNHISAEGQFGLDRMRIISDKKIPTVSLITMIKADLDLSQEEARISSLNITLNNLHQIYVSADISELFTTPKASVVVKKAKFDLERLMIIAAAFVPEISLQGKVSIKDIHLQGGVDKTPVRLAGGQVRLKGVECKIPSRQIEIKELDGQLNIGEVVLHPDEKLPRSMKLDVDIGCQNASGVGFRAEEVQFKMDIHSKADQDNQVNLSVSLNQLTGSDDNPISVKGIEINGNISEIIIRENKPESAKLVFQTQFKSAEISGLALTDVQVGLNGDIKHPDLTESDLEIKIDLGKGEMAGEIPVHLAGFNSTIRLDDLLLDNNTLKKVKATINFQNHSVSLPDIDVKNIEGYISASAAGEKLEQNNIRIKLQAKQIKLDDPEVKEISLELSGAAGGNFRQGDINIKTLQFEVDDFLTGTISGKISHFKDFSLLGSSILDLNKLKIPPIVEEAVGKIDTGGELIISTEIKSIQEDLFTPPSAGSIPLALTFDSKIQFRKTDLQIQKPQITLKNLHTDLGVQGRFSSSRGIEDVTLAGTASFGDVNLPKLVSLDKGDVNLSFFSKDKLLSDSTLTLDLQCYGARSLKENFEIPPADFQLEIQSDQQIPEKTVQIKKMIFRIPEKVYFESDGTIKEWGKLFDLNLKGMLSDLEWATQQTPVAIRKNIPLSELGGALDFQFHLRGKQPTDEDFQKLNIPIDATGTVTLNGVHFTYHEKEINNLNMITNLSHRDGMGKLSGSLDLDSPENELAPLGFTYTIHLGSGFDRLRIDKGTELVLAGGKIRLGVHGEIGGLKLFIEPGNLINPESILKRISAHLKINIDGVAKEDLDLPGNFQVRGRVQNDLKIDLNPGNFFRIEGMLRLDDFWAKGEKVLLNNMLLKFPYHKKLYLFQIPEEEDSLNVEAPLPLKGVFTSLERFSQIHNNLQIHRLKVGKVDVQNIFGNLALKGESIGADRFGMDLFGGGLGGNFIIFSDPENHIIQFSSEFAGIGFDSLLMPPIYRTGNTQNTIGGNLKLAIYFDRRGSIEEVDLKRIDLHLRITHIGYDSLNQLLLFLDPEESNPSILNARNTLKLATPVMVDLQIAYGNLSLALALESKILGGTQFSMPVLNRIPLDLLKNFDKIDAGLNKLAPIKHVMEILSAKGVTFDEEKKVKFLQ